MILEKCLVLGYDRLGNTEMILQKHGYTVGEHWTGRGKKLPRKLPRDISAVVVFTKKINHEWSIKVKDLAKEKGKEIYFARGIAELNKILSA